MVVISRERTSFWPLVAALVGMAILLLSEHALFSLVGVLALLSSPIFYYKSCFDACRIVGSLVWFSGTSIWMLYLITGGGFAVSPWDFLIALGLSVLGTAAIVFVCMMIGFVAALKVP